MMKLVKGNKERDNNAKVILQDGAFQYELQKDILKLPDFLQYVPLCTGCCDKNDFLYLVTRDYRHPIVVVDRDGEYVRDFGEGLFQFIHSIFVTDHNTLLCADANAHVIRELSLEGEVIRGFGELWCAK